MKFINQKKAYDCGPVCVINYSIWAGLGYNESDLPWLRYAMGTDPDTSGSELYNVVAVIKSINPSARVRFTTDPSGPLNALDKGHGIIAAHAITIKDEVMHHICFIYKRGSDYIGVNLITQKPEVKLTRDHIRAMVGMTDDNGIDFTYVVVGR